MAPRPKVVVSWSSGKDSALALHDVRRSGKLDRSFAGRGIDDARLGVLPAGVDPCAENGAFHTFAWAATMFRRPVPVTVGEVVDRDGFLFADLLPCAAARLS